MGTTQICHLCHKSKRLIISLLFLLLSSSTFMGFVAQGRQVSKLTETPAQKGTMDEKMAVRRQVIGSTPPRCDRRCNSCGHCEAVQVPVTTRFVSRKSRISTAISNIAYYRGDGVSNYKPMSWKCKCGNLIFNP
ncbi:EPIDERMAL PATTERNING FACTOR-like protein 2 [Mercurialis annua]|uniref:EPIDERMAL PATTERNING FACTOR-like protein 2 n=1 Tax=Mercurialis annua TaxID=3986 RepID=UPI0021604922|nr:EPIDERMAL PATTERNING FACTOR-like protein 2 [Mercurialis annua]